MTTSGSSRGSYGANTVTTTAEVISPAGYRGSVLIRNNHASNVLYLGFDSSVTDANGFPLAAGESVEIYDFIGEIWGYASAAGTDVRVLETGGV
jgi:hypothetical protein